MKNTKLNKGKFLSILLIAVIIGIVIIGFSGCINEEKPETAVNETFETENDYKIITDMWDREVKIPKNPQRVVVADFTGTYLKTMKIWKIDDKIVAVDEWQKKKQFFHIICPRLEEIPDVGSSWNGYNYESIAASNPDVVIIRADADTLESRKRYEEQVDRLEKLNITVIVLLHPSSFKEPNVDTMWQEIRILGEIFDKEQDADELIDNLDSKIKLVNGRTKDIPESDKPEVLLFGTPNWVLGKQIIQSYFLENIVHANNVAGEGTWSIISAEQMLALNPDVIIVMAHADYVSLEEVYAGEDTGFNWKLVQEAKAIKEHSVCSLGDPEWRAESLEGIIGTLRMAKTIYPEKFEDIDPDKEEIKLYKELYGLTDEEVEKAVAAQRPKKK
jgi:iron complex transport system substrate-binding protein